MTKKDFIALGNALLRVKPETPTTLRQWVLDVKAIAEVCVASNPRFDYQYFMKYCGVE